MNIFIDPYNIFNSPVIKKINYYKSSGFRDYGYIDIDKYIKQLSDIVFCDTNPIPIKYILSKKGYKSMNLRLPMTKLENHSDIDIILNL